MSGQPPKRVLAASDEGAVSYRIDAENLVTAVNDAWCAFAHANRGEHLLPSKVIGKSLWELLGDEATREIYATLLQRVRAGSGQISFPLRCDAPEWVRRLTATIRRVDGEEVEFRFRLASQRPRPPARLLDVLHERSGELLTICGWCSKVPTPDGRWLEVEEACQELGILESDAPPRLTHGICSACSQAMLDLASS